MDKIKHIIATRFLCFEGNLGEQVTSKEFIEMGLRLMSQYLIPTLENQTNQNFELVVLVHPKLNLGQYKRKFLAMSDKLNINVIRYAKFDEYVAEAAKTAENLIVSRIDYDDLVWKGAVEDAQNHVGKAPMLIYGYNRGYAWHEGTDDIRHFYWEYRKHGHMSVFQSSIVKTENAELVAIHPYKWNHTRPTESASFAGVDMKKVRFEAEYALNAFIWVRHDNSSSGYIFPSYVKERAALEKAYVQQVFGVAVVG